MDTSDISSGEVSLHATWMALGHRIAVVLGASTALISLVAQAPLLEASRRGALAWLATFALVRIGAWLMARTEPPEDEGEPEDGDDSRTAPNDPLATRALNEG